jgi:fructokinase
MSVSVVCFGEILWDLLPSGEQPGGAPMNVAYHLQKLGVPAALISRVGTDDYGDRLLRYVQEQGLNTDYVQKDEQHKTGLVYAHLNEQHEATYEIVQPVAWDYIEWDDRFSGLVHQAEYFVYGSLSARSQTSKATLLRLLQAANKKVFDVNIRPPHFNKESAEPLLPGLEILKLNEHELPVLSGWIKDGGSFEDQVEQVQEHYQVPVVVVTRGSDGAVLRTGGTWYVQKGYNGLLSQLQIGSAPDEALSFACATGALVATYSGACPQYVPEEIERLRGKE